MSTGPPFDTNDVVGIFDYLVVAVGAEDRVDVTALKKVSASGVEWRAREVTPDEFEMDYRNTIRTLRMPAIAEPARMWRTHHGFIWIYDNYENGAYEIQFNAAHADTSDALGRTFALTANSASEFGMTVEVCREQLDWLIDKRQAAVDLFARGHPLFFDVESIWVGPPRG